MLHEFEKTFLISFFDCDINSHMRLPLYNSLFISKLYNIIQKKYSH